MILIGRDEAQTPVRARQLFLHFGCGGPRRPSHVHVAFISLASILST